jgi:hypothetical protein
MDYRLLFYLCGEDRVPDIAAGLYVGMVEEWIMEGRVAEGASPGDFYEGGGPPREGREELELRSDLLKTWWRGVRSWALPGEVLSPHDRLDLWHPKKLALAEKLRTFPLPIPTSPPTSAPAPTDQLLERVVATLKLNPVDLEYKASMRACAMLSNTILTRTIPYISSRILLNVLERTPMHPPVYPEGITPDESDEWAYAAYTHIHLALRSLLFHPPVLGTTIAYHRASHAAVAAGQSRPPIPTQIMYMTYPLSAGACRALVKYGLRKLRRPRMVQNMLSYAKQLYGLVDTSLMNVLYRELTLLREWKAVDRVEAILFGGTNLASSKRKAVPGQETLVIPTPDETVAFDDHSISALISRCCASGQSSRLIKLTYDLIPFLRFSRSMSFEDSLELADETGMNHLVRSTGRPRPAPLTPYLYAGLINGLAKFSQPSLAQRVFHLAMQAEYESARSSAGIQHTQFRIPIHVFTSMIIAWHKQSVSADLLGVESWPVGWSTPRGSERFPRKQAAEMMIWLTYRQALRRWKTSKWEEMKPDERFFDAMLKARMGAWSVNNRAGFQGRLKEVETIVGDMESVGLEIPRGLIAILEGRTDSLVWKEKGTRRFNGFAMADTSRRPDTLKGQGSTFRNIPDEALLFEKEAESAIVL